MKPALFDPLLALGDALALAVVTLIGFATHGELSSAGLRLLSTFVPLCIGWALISPWLGLYHTRYTHSVRDLWRPLLAMFLAAPLAAWLRGFWLNEAIPPVFVLVIAATSALAILLWRSAWLLIGRKAKRPAYGQ